MLFQGKLPTPEEIDEKIWARWRKSFSKELEVSCPSCGAQVGQRCQQVKKSRFNRLHSYRPIQSKPHLRRVRQVKV